MHHTHRCRWTIALAASSALVITPLGGCREKPATAGGPYGDIVRKAVPAVEKAVGLRFKTPPKVETRSKAQVRDFLLAQLHDSATQVDLTGKEQAYKLLGMIPDTLDLETLLTNLLVEQIVGFYDPKTKVLYVVDGSPESIVQTVVTHELVHALQDQYVSLDSVDHATGDNDRESAAHAVFEGQAVYEQLEAMLGSDNMAVALPGGWDRVRQTIRNNQASMPVYSSAPLVIQETLLFPYLSGAEFIKSYKEHEPGGVPYRDMPVSTEQIIHQYAYFGTRDNPTPVSFALPASLRSGYGNDLGEFETRLFLYQHLNDEGDAVRGAAGWDGDRYVVLTTPRGAAIAWATVWDTDNDAADFYNLLQRIREADVAASRSVKVTTGEVDGRPVVLWVDVPNGANMDVVGLQNVRLGRSE